LLAVDGIVNERLTAAFPVEVTLPRFSFGSAKSPSLFKST